MTKRDFFILLLKIFGLFSVVTSLFSVLPSNFSFAMIEIDAFSIVWIITTLIIIIGLFVLLIFKSRNIVELLKLDQGFDDDSIELGNLGPSDIIKIGTFIIGGLLVLDTIPAFLSHTLFAFKADIIRNEYPTEGKFNWAVSGMNLIIGFILITRYDLIAKRFKSDNVDK